MVLICLNACSGAKTSDNVTVYVTTNDRAKDFVRSEIALGDKQAASPSVITIDPSVRYQTMDGFGAAVTGSTCYNLMRMAPEDRTAFLKETFSDTEGMGLYAQLTDKIRQQISGGVLVQGDKLPSVRELAVELSINPNTIQRAYRQLEMEGWIATVPGKGCFVCGCPAEDPQEELKCLNTLEETVQKLLAMGYTRQELIQKIEEADPCSK